MLWLFYGGAIGCFVAVRLMVRVHQASYIGPANLAFQFAGQIVTVKLDNAASCLRSSAQPRRRVHLLLLAAGAMLERSVMDQFGLLRTGIRGPNLPHERFHRVKASDILAPAELERVRHAWTCWARCACSTPGRRSPGRWR